MNIKYPSKACGSGIQRNVFVKFVGETDGTLSNVKVLKGIGGGCDEGTVRVVKQCHNRYLVSIKEKM